MIETALLYAVLSTGEQIVEGVPRWFCERVVVEIERGSDVKMVAMDGSISPVARAACYSLAASVGDCEMGDQS